MLFSTSEGNVLPLGYLVNTNGEGKALLYYCYCVYLWLRSVLLCDYYREYLWQGNVLLHDCLLRILLVKTICCCVAVIAL